MPPQSSTPTSRSPVPASPLTPTNGISNTNAASTASLTATPVKANEPNEQIALKVPKGKCSHYDVNKVGECKQIVGDEIFQFSLDKIVEIFFNDQSVGGIGFDVWDYFYKNEPTFKPYVKSYSMTKWVLDQKGCCLIRDTKAMSPPVELAFGLGNKPTKIEQKHRCYFEDDNNFVYMTFSYGKEVSYCDNFHVDTLWRFTRSDNGKVKCVVSCDVIMVNPPWGVKGIIVSCAKDPARINTTLTYEVLKKRAKELENLANATPSPNESETKTTASNGESKPPIETDVMKPPLSDDRTETVQVTEIPKAFKESEERLPLLLTVLGFLLCSAFAYLSSVVTTLQHTQNLLLRELAQSSGLLKAVLTEDKDAKAMWLELPPDSLLKVLVNYKENAAKVALVSGEYREKMEYLDQIIAGSYSKSTWWSDTYGYGVLLIVSAAVAYVGITKTKYY